MFHKIKAYVEEHHMLGEQDRVVVGISGGADSVCLLFVLLELKKELGFSLVAVHVHHGIRGESADADENYVRKVCAEQGVELLVFHENVRDYALENGCTEEEAGRNVRRNIFEKVMKEKNGTRIALAHHKNDNVETFLWNLCRGTGLNGLGGIRPVAGEYIRPLLCVGRDDIENYLKAKGISYCTDETNAEDAYTRNRIRNNVIPYLEEQVNAQTVCHVADVIENIRTFNEYVEKEVEKYVRSCVITEKEKWVIKENEYENIPEVFKGHVIHEVLGMAAGKKKDIASIHIRIVEELFGKQVGRKADLPYGMLAVRTYEGVEVGKCLENAKGEALANARIRVFDRDSEMVTFPEKTYTKWFDYDIIKRTVKIRHREPGDYIVIDKNGRTQKLKQYFINEKIPQNVRNQIWLIADGQEIMWIVGYRQSQAYQITDKTTKIMEICFEGKDFD